MFTIFNKVASFCKKKKPKSNKHRKKNIKLYDRQWTKGLYASEEILGNTPLVQLIFCLQGLMLDWMNTLWKQFELQVIPRINPAFTYMCYHQLTFCTEVIWVFCAENSKDFFCKLFACSAIMSSSERSPLTCNESWKWIHLANVHNYISQLIT